MQDFPPELNKSKFNPGEGGTEEEKAPKEEAKKEEEKKQ